MRGTKYLPKVTVMVAALTLVLAACSSSSDSASTTPATSATEAPTTAATESPTPTTGEGTAVAVAVGETDVQHMYMNVDATTVPAGTVTFTVVNEGVKKHEFVILSTDVMAADMKVEGNDEVNEDLYTNAGEAGELPPGETGTLTVDLAPGHYALICNLKGHMRMGMYADITVT